MRPRAETEKPVGTVLIVDDNLGFLRVAQVVLETGRPCFGVHTVSSGNEAVRFLERRPPFVEAPRPAFIVLDFRLPDMNAPAVLNRLASSEDLGSIPVLVMSQADWEDDEEAARSAGAAQFRVKPSSVHGLRHMMLDFWRDHVHGV